MVHTVCTRVIFPVNTENFVFLSVYYSVNVTFDLCLKICQVCHDSLLRTTIIVNVAIISKRIDREKKEVLFFS